MRSKYYAILCKDNKMTFPIKAPRNELTGARQFAGGYPAMFGGTDKGGVNATLTAEISEESRRTLKSDTQFKMFFRGGHPQDSMFFFWTDTWTVTETKWGPPVNRDEGEMLKVVTVPFDGFSWTDSPDTVLKKLITASGAPGGSEEQYAEFLQSETAAAFVQCVYDNVPYDE